MPSPHSPQRVPLTLTLIVATTPSRAAASLPSLKDGTEPTGSPRSRLGIGSEGGLPWPRIKADMSFFARVTSRTTAPGTTNAIIMGRKTYFSLPRSLRPLSKRINIVVTRDTTGSVQKGILSELREQREKTKKVVSTKGGTSAPKENMSTDLIDEPVTDAMVSGSITAALDELDDTYGRNGKLGKVFVIGGAEIYRAVLQLGRTRKEQEKSEEPMQNPTSMRQRRPPLQLRIVMTHVKKKGGSLQEFQCDTFFPEDDLTPGSGWRAASTEEVSEWVGEAVSPDWRDEGDVSIQVVGFERLR